MKSLALFDESWFYVPDVDLEDLRLAKKVELPSEEVHHAFQVLRLREGQSIVVSNGRGDVLAGVLSGSSKSGFFLPTDRHREKAPEPTASLATAILKGKDSEDPIAACCQLPIADVFLLRTEHSQFFNGQDHEKLLQRLRQKSIVALKQARKPYLTRIHAPIPLVEWRQTQSDSVLVYAHPGVDTLPTKAGQKFSLCIGPEGGFSASELTWFLNEKQSYRMGLGETRLRAEQAPLVGLGKLMGLGWL
jgi:16S rRNA (uracil1498-N3)-methyltransferase